MHLFVTQCLIQQNCPSSHQPPLLPPGSHVYYTGMHFLQKQVTWPLTAGSCSSESSECAFALHAQAVLRNYKWLTLMKLSSPRIQKFVFKEPIQTIDSAIPLCHIPARIHLDRFLRFAQSGVVNKFIVKIRLKRMIHSGVGHRFRQHGYWCCV